MKIREKENHDMIGFATDFNPMILDEIYVHFPDHFHFGHEKMDKYEYYIESIGEWVDEKRAFGKEKLTIVNKYNTSFLEPKTEEDRKRGYEL